MSSSVKNFSSLLRACHRVVWWVCVCVSPMDQNTARMQTRQRKFYNVFWQCLKRTGWRPARIMEGEVTELLQQGSVRLPLAENHELWKKTQLSSDKTINELICQCLVNQLFALAFGFGKLLVCSPLKISNMSLNLFPIIVNHFVCRVTETNYLYFWCSCTKRIQTRLPLSQTSFQVLAKSNG